MRWQWIQIWDCNVEKWPKIQTAGPRGRLSRILPRSPRFNRPDSNDQLVAKLCGSLLMMLIIWICSREGELGKHAGKWPPDDQSLRTPPQHPRLKGWSIMCPPITDLFNGLRDQGYLFWVVFFKGGKARFNSQRSLVWARRGARMDLPVRDNSTFF